MASPRASTSSLIRSLARIPPLQQRQSRFQAPCTCFASFISHRPISSVVRRSTVASLPSLSPSLWQHRSELAQPPRQQQAFFSTRSPAQYLELGKNDGGTATSNSIGGGRLHESLTAASSMSHRSKAAIFASTSSSNSNSTAGGLVMRCTTLNRQGNVTTTSGSFTKAALCSKYQIQPRDLRKIDSKVPSVVPTILIRKSCILVTLLHLRVVITANEVTLFDSVGTEDSWLKGVFLYHLEHNLKLTTKAAAGLPYEFRALESCLVSVLSALENEMQNLRSLVIDLLSALEEDISRDKLKLLLHYSRKLSAFQKRATLVQECLEEVLEADDDLAAMYLTAKAEGKPRASHEHEEIELLLESFDTQVEEIVSEIDNLATNVRSTEDIVELILDSNRNELLALDLKVSIGTLGLTSGALVAGLFGMNLATSLETHTYAFPLITLSAFTFTAIVTIVGLKRLRKMRKMGLGSSDQIAGNKMLLERDGRLMGRVGAGGGGAGGGRREESKKKSRRD